MPASVALVRFCNQRAWLGLPLAIILLLLPHGTASANPVPESAVKVMNERPTRWVARPNTTDERELVQQFGHYGLALLSAETFALLSKEFDRFAPLMIAGQRPPYAPDLRLQGWFRERADDAQAAAMRSALRQWLTADIDEGQYIIRGSMGEGGPRVITQTRLEAARALSDWRATEALPELRALSRRVEDPERILAVAIHRIERPDLPDLMTFDSEGRVRLGRKSTEIDSIVVVFRGNGDGTRVRTRSGGSARLWAALETGTRGTGDWSSDDPPPLRAGSYEARELEFYFRRDGRASLGLGGVRSRWDEISRPGIEYELRTPVLREALQSELERMNLSALAARFVEESVTLRIRPGWLEVDGIYQFAEIPALGRLPIVYPINSENGHGRPIVELVEMTTFTKGKPREPVRVPFDKGVYDIRFTLLPGDSPEYRARVRYRQPLRARTATYLTTTARTWDRPLARAWFQVIIDESLGAPRFDLPFREVASLEPGTRRFSWEVSPYQPEHDIQVRW